MKNTRREFLKDSLKLTTVLSIPAVFHSCNKPPNKIKYGVVTDIHQDLIPDAEDRLRTFINQSQSRKLDFIIQMGDFCIPKPENQRFTDLFNDYSGDKYHVLGNHDTDGGFSREQAMDFWTMRAKYYSFDYHGVHFVVLDGNDPNPQPFEGYNRFIGAEQLEWLRRDLSGTKFLTIIFSHQTLENEDGGVVNMSEVRGVLEEINESAKFAKVIACFCGHHHTDYHTMINGIYYIQINSASYHWVGENYKVKRFSEEIHKKYQWLEYMIPYQDPLYTFVTIDPGGYLTIESKQSSFVGPGPEQMGMPLRPENDPIVPYISGKKLTI